MAAEDEGILKDFHPPYYLQMFWWLLVRVGYPTVVSAILVGVLLGKVDSPLTSLVKVVNLHDQESRQARSVLISSAEATKALIEFDRAERKKERCLTALLKPEQRLRAYTYEDPCVYVNELAADLIRGTR